MNNEEGQYYIEAVEYFDKQEFDRAILSATKAINLNPDFAPAYSVRGTAHYGKEEYLKSIDDHTNAIKFTKKMEAVIRSEIPESNNDNINKILNELTKSKAFDYFHRGNAYDDIDDFKNAEKDFSEAIKLYPEFANAYNSRGIVYNKNADYISAIEDFTKAIQYKYTKLAFSYNNRASAFQHLERYEEAIKDCQKAIEIDPAYAHAYNTCGLTYEAMNDYENAGIFYKKAIAIDPGYSTAKKNLETLGKKRLTFGSSVSVSLNSGINFLEDE